MEVAYGSANNMRDLHQVVIDHIGEMIRWVAISFDNNEIFFGLALLVAVVHDVVELHRDGAALESDGVRLAAAPLGFFERNLAASPWVVCRGPSDMGFGFMPLKVGGRTEAPVRLAFLDESLGVAMIMCIPLRLCMESASMHGKPGAIEIRWLTCLYGPNGPPTSGPNVGYVSVPKGKRQRAATVTFVP